MPVENTNQPAESTSPAQQETAFESDAFSKALTESQQSTESTSTQAAAAAAGGTAAAPAQQPAAIDWQAAAKEAGFTVDQYKSPADFYKAMAAERQQQQQLMTQMSSWLGAQQAAAAQAARQQQPAEQPKQQDDPNAWLKEHFGKAWKVPAFDPQWQAAIRQGLLVLDEDGKYAAAPGAEFAVGGMIAPANAFRDAQAERMQELFLRGNPFEQIHEALAPAIERQMREMISAELGQHTQQVTQQSALEQWEQANFSLLYTQDTAGNQIETPAGKALIEEASRLKEKYNMDPMEALDLACARTGFKPATPGQQQQAPPTAQQQLQAKKESFIDKAKAGATHGPSMNTNTPQAPVSIDQSELDQFFVNEFHRQQAG